MQMNTIPVPAARQHQPITPETPAALKTARAAEFRLEAEYFAFDWQARLELAEELYRLADELPDHFADVTLRVASDLESDLEDFSTWDTRSDAAAAMRRVIRALESDRQEVRVHA